MARKKTPRRSSTLQGLSGSDGKAFVGTIAGTKMHCRLLGRPGRTRKLRCEAMRAGPGNMSKPARRRAGVKALKKAKATVSVPKGKVTIKSGPRKGKLRKGCRRKGTRAYCTPAVAKSLGKRRSTTKKRTTKKRRTTKRRTTRKKR